MATTSTQLPGRIENNVTLRDYLLALIEERDNKHSQIAEERDKKYEQRFEERDKKYEQRFEERDNKYAQRFEAIDRAVLAANDAVKDARDSAHATTKDAIASASAAAKDALTTANLNIASVLAGLDKRFDSVNEFRGQLADQQETFARKSDLESLVASLKEAVLKAEAQHEKRFESVNEFRAQLADQQSTFSRRGETDIQFTALNNKLDTAISQLNENKGRDHAMSLVWGAVAVVVSVAISIGSIILKR